MASPVHSAQVFRFGLFEVDVAQNVLTRNGMRVKIADQSLCVLIHLLGNPGRIVTREELRHKLWPEGTYVDFDGSLNVILKRLRAALGDDPENPCFIETVPRRGYRFIAPVSVEPPRNSAETAPKADVHSPVAAELPPVAMGRGKRWPVSRYLAVLALLLFVMGAIWYSWRRKHSIANPLDISLKANAFVPLRKSVAVLGFRNASSKPDDAWLSTAISEMLSTELAGGDKLRLVSGEEVANLRIASPWSQTDTLDQNTTARIGTALNSDLLVLGSYTAVGGPDRGQLRLDARLQDVKTGEILTETAETGDRQDLFQLVSRVGVRLRERLGVPPLGEPDQASELASMPSNREAARLYALGLARLRAFDAIAARDLLQQACKADPQFSLGHLMLARAWGQLGYEQKRKEETKKAFDLSANLPRTERMLVEGDYYESMADHERAASTYRALFELFPDSIDYGLLLAAAESAAGQGSQGLATLDRIRRLPPPASLDLRIDLAEESNSVSSGKYQAAESTAAKAVAKARAKGLDLLLATALNREADDLAHVGQPDQAISAAEEARSIYSRVGDRFGVAGALTTVGTVQWIHGDYDASEKTFEQVLATNAAIGNKTGMARNLRFIGNAWAMHGDLPGARQQYQKALSIYREIGDRSHVAYSLIQIAWVENSSGGEPKAILNDYDQALAIFRDLSNEEGVAEVLGEKGGALVTLGELSAAQQSCQESLDLYRKSGEKSWMVRALFDLGNIASLQDRDEDSRKRFSEALAIVHETRDAGEDIIVNLGLARLEKEEGHLAESRKLLDHVFGLVHAHKNPNEEISANNLLAETALQEGNLAEAQAAIGAAQNLLRPGQFLEGRYVFGITNARIQAATGNLRGARDSLKALVADTARHHYVHYELEARLALCEVELKADPSTAHLEARELQKEASLRGFNRIARKALALQS